MPGHAVLARKTFGIDVEPISDLNITPLIDVMLVLLVMFILAVPAMTHKVPIDLPQSRPDRSLPMTTHRLALAIDGSMTLDGTAVPDAALLAALAPIRADAQATLVLWTDPETRYARFDAVLAAIKRAGITRLGFDGNAAMVG